MADKISRDNVTEKLKKATKVRLNDFSEYDAEKCRNGGSYGFWTDYIRQESGLWEVSCGTTSDMEFCPVCGQFGDHYDGEMEEYSCGDFERVTTEQLSEIIGKFFKYEEDPDSGCYIEIEE